MGLDGLSYVARSLQAYSAALDVTGQNLSQMNAPGYTRQRLTPNPGAAPVSGLPPSGVRIDTPSYHDDGIERLRSAFLDRATRAQMTNAAGATATNALLQQVSTVFDETNVDGIIADATKLSAAISDAALEPTNMHFRQTVLTRADALAATFESKGADLQQAVDLANFQIEESVTKINSVLQELSHMNGYVPRPPTADTNAMLDRRDVLLDELSQYMDLTVAAQPQGDLVVYGGGVPLLFGHTARTIELSQDINGLPVLSTETGKQISPVNGKLGSLVKLQTQTLPAYISRLNDLARNLTDEINQRLMNSNDLTGVSGAALFRMTAGAAGVATSADVQFVSATGATHAGTYDLRITQAAEQGQVQGRLLTVAQVSGAGGVSGETAAVGATLNVQAGATNVTLNIGSGSLSDVISAINSHASLRNVVTASANGANLVIATQTLSTNPADLQVTFNSPTNAFGLDASLPGGVQTTGQATAGARARLANNETLTFTDGAGAQTQITLTAGTIVSTAVTQLNTVLEASNIHVNATFSAGSLRLTNTDFGSATNVKNTVASTLDNSAGANGLGVMAVAATSGTIADAAHAVLFNSQVAGRDVAGTISGNAAVGVGQVLTGTDGLSTGLSVRFSGSTPPVGFDAGQITVSNGKPVLTMRRVLDNPAKLAFSSGSLASVAPISAANAPISATNSIADESAKFNVALSTGSGTILVNGEEVNWDNGQSLNDVLAQIPGVIAQFDTVKQTVRLTRDPSYGSTGPAITVSDVTGNLVAALGLDTAVLDKGVPGDSSTAQQLIDVIHGNGLAPSEERQGIEGLRALEGDVALEASLARGAESTASNVLKALEAQRQQDGGVNADEEAVNLIQYQRAYESAVQLAKAQDNLLTTLIDMISSTR